jgi:hypothetical protein
MKAAKDLPSRLCTTTELGGADDDGEETFVQWWKSGLTHGLFPALARAARALAQLRTTTNFDLVCSFHLERRSRHRDG